MKKKYLALKIATIIFATIATSCQSKEESIRQDNAIIIQEKLDKMPAPRQTLPSPPAQEEK